MSDTRIQVNYTHRYQAMVNCPKCGFLHTIELKDTELGDGHEVNCVNCGFKFVLDNSV